MATAIAYIFFGGEGLCLLQTTIWVVVSYDWYWGFCYIVCGSSRDHCQTKWCNFLKLYMYKHWFICIVYNFREINNNSLWGLKLPIVLFYPLLSLSFCIATLPPLPNFKFSSYFKFYLSPHVNFLCPDSLSPLSNVSYFNLVLNLDIL